MELGETYLEKVNSSMIKYVAIFVMLGYPLNQIAKNSYSNKYRITRYLNRILLMFE